MGSTSTGTAFKDTFGGGSSAQTRATGFGNLQTAGSFRSDLASFAENPAAFFRGLSGQGGGQNDSVADENIELDLNAFKAKLAEINPQFFEADFGLDDIRGIANQFRDIGQGAPDPRFQRFQDAQFNIFESGAASQRANAASNLARRGLLGSSTGLNQLGGIDAQLGQRREALGAQLGMQQLGRQDQALQNALGAFGQAAAMQDLQLNARSAGLENLLAIPSLQVAQQAAINAGKLPEEEKAGILSGLFKGII